MGKRTQDYVEQEGATNTEAAEPKKRFESEEKFTAWVAEVDRVMAILKKQYPHTF